MFSSTFVTRFFSASSARCFASEVETGEGWSIVGVTDDVAVAGFSGVVLLLKPAQPAKVTIHTSNSGRPIRDFTEHSPDKIGKYFLKGQTGTEGSFYQGM